MSRILVWFSNGVASACAAYFALKKYGSSAILVHCDTHSEHPDNARFRADVTKWLDYPIVTIQSEKYHDVDDVIEQTRYLRGPKGARCTTELKKIPRMTFQEVGDIHILGYTADEQSRINRFYENNPELKSDFVLPANFFTKDRCLAFIRQVGIELPEMYKLGFNHNNCLGCLKAESPVYWLAILKHFPEVYACRAKQERLLKFALCRYKKQAIYLDELPYMQFIGDLSIQKMPEIQCDLVCYAVKEALDAGKELNL